MLTALFWDALSRLALWNLEQETAHSKTIIRINCFKVRAIYNNLCKYTFNYSRSKIPHWKLVPILKFFLLF